MPTRRDYTDDSRIALTDASERAARVFGIVFILIGIALIVFLIGGFIISKLGYRTDPNLPIPTLDSVDEYTNEDSIDLSGTALPDETVVLYIDENRSSSTAETDEDGTFVIQDIPLDEEGTVDFTAAVVRGSIFKRKSEFSNKVTITADWTAPSSTISLDYGTSATSDKTSIKGVADASSIVIIEGNGKTYEGTTDENGAFEIKDVVLVDGDNTFEVRIKDLAGNEVITSKQIKITYAAGDIDGPGESTGPGELPESAGELDAAMAVLTGNKLMLGIAVLTVLAFSGSAVLTQLKLGSDKKNY